jgi:hypothetical protein
MHWPARREQPENSEQTRTHLPDITDSLKEHMQQRYQLGNASTTGIYWRSWQAVLQHAVKAASNRFLHDPQVTLAQKRAILCYRTGTLYNAKLAVRFGHHTAAGDLCPLCGTPDSGGHILSGCQHASIRNMVAERHNAAGRLIAKAIGKGTQGGNIVCMDVGSEARLRASGIETEDISTRHLPTWLLPEDARAILRGHESRPDLVLVASKGDSRHQGDPRNMPTNQLCITTVELKYCADTMFTNQLEQAQTQHARLIELFKERGSEVKHIPILLGIGGTIYKEHTKARLAELGVEPGNMTKLLYKLNGLAATWAASLVRTRRQLEHNLKQTHAPHLVQRARGPAGRQARIAVDPG